MEFPIDQIAEIKKIYPGAEISEEAGVTYFLLPKLDMPEGCVPSNVDALFCPTNRDGYSSRLFFAEKITGCPVRNWNGQARILDRSWYAISWNINPNQRLIQLIRSHIDAFRK